MEPFSWSGRCLNSSCKTPRMFKFSAIRRGDVLFCVCPECQQKYCLVASLDLPPNFTFTHVSTMKARRPIM